MPKEIKTNNDGSGGRPLSDQGKKTQPTVPAPAHCRTEGVQMNRFYLL